jgi:hypothetical protein
MSAPPAPRMNGVVRLSYLEYDTGRVPEKEVSKPESTCGACVTAGKHPTIPTTSPATND